LAALNEGLKHTSYDDAFYLAELLRLGILPEGYIYPKMERSLRDFLRKRLMLVRQRTADNGCIRLPDITTMHIVKKNRYF
jgi:hypothetical protein